jgi:hypothetical protein
MFAKNTRYSGTAWDDPAVADEPPEVDIDRVAILARRRRFILMALGGLSGVGGCRQVEPPQNPIERIEDASMRPPYEPVRLPPPAVVSIDTPPPRLISDEELMAILQDPERDLCVDIPFASAGPSETRVDLTEDQKAQVAKVLYERGQRAQAEGDLECALELFEEAYYQVPGKHRYAFLVGELAATVGDCVKAWDFLEHFLAYGDDEKYRDERERAQALLDTPEMRSCARPPKAVPSPDSHPMVCLEMPFPDPEPPASPPETKRQRRDRERAERKAEREQERASKMFRRK